MIKKSYCLAAAVMALTACSNDEQLTSGNNSEGQSQNAIGFQFINRNIITDTRTGDGSGDTQQSAPSGKTYLNNAGHYNFGVFAYKNVGSTPSMVMDNYLVGYGDDTNKKGYKMESGKQTTLSSSNWAYEKLGSSDYSYTNTTGENYYTGSEDFYKSNNANQYLKFWDNSAASTDFYAYAPYLNKDADSQGTASFSTNDKKLTIPSTGISDGYNDASKYDFIYAHKNVTSNNYGNEVQIDFKRMSAKMKIGFYADINGYDVTILDLKEGASGVCAAPAVKGENDTYNYGTLYHKAGAVVDFSSDTPSLTITGNSEQVFKNEHLTFTIPTGTVSTTKASPTMSTTEYYLIPDNATNQTGLTFHVTYQLKAKDTNETITVKDATVYVPYQKDENTKYCAWQSNYIYTYIFKITKDTTGSTETDPTIDPNSPTPNTDKALQPIIFDNCTVEDWTNATSTEHTL